MGYNDRIIICGGCGGAFTRQELVEVTNREGVRVLACKSCHSNIMADDIARRTGASFTVCASCGTSVPVHESVRSYMPVTNKGGEVTGSKLLRVCRYCAKQDPIPPWCRHGDHRIVVTPASTDWQDEDFPFSPLPEDSRPGMCGDCRKPLLWSNDHWTEMTWGLLASEWQRAGG